MLFSDGPALDGVGLDKDREPIPSTSGTQPAHPSPMDVDVPVRDDGFGTNLDQNIIGKFSSCDTFLSKMNSKMVN